LFLCFVQSRVLPIISSIQHFLIALIDKMEFLRIVLEAEQSTVLALISIKQLLNKNQIKWGFLLSEQAKCLVYFLLNMIEFVNEQFWTKRNNNKNKMFSYWWNRRQSSPARKVCSLDPRTGESLVGRSKKWSVRLSLQFLKKIL
jgi:hypothetical protein